MGRVDDTEGLDSVSKSQVARWLKDSWARWHAPRCTHMERARGHAKKTKNVTQAPSNFPFNSHFDFPPFRRTVLQSGSPYSLAALQCDALALPVTH